MTDVPTPLDTTLAIDGTPTEFSNIEFNYARLTYRVNAAGTGSNPQPTVSGPFGFVVRVKPPVFGALNGLIGTVVTVDISYTGPMPMDFHLEGMRVVTAASGWVCLYAEHEVEDTWSS